MKFAIQRYITWPYLAEFKIWARNAQKPCKNLPKFEKWSFWCAVFTEKSKIILSTIWTIQTIHTYHQFSSKAEKPHFWPPWSQFWKNRTFSGKSGSVSFRPLWCPNFMQKIRKNKWANSEKNSGQTDRLMDKGEVVAHKLSISFYLIKNFGWRRNAWVFTKKGQKTPYPIV